MKIKNDFYYISQLEQKLIDKGLACLDVHSIHLEGKNTEEENTKIKNIVDMLNEKFLIYQYEKKNDRDYICKYEDNWDLFFWHNGTLEFPFSDTRLSFNNSKRNYEERQNDLKILINLLGKYKENSVTIRIQYKTLFHEEEITKLADDIYKKLKGKFINYNGYDGKIKPVDKYMDHYYGIECKYGFFKKGSKRKYYQLTNMSIVAME